MKAKKKKKEKPNSQKGITSFTPLQNQNENPESLHYGVAIVAIL